jgi:hypothetical protein
MDINILLLSLLRKRFCLICKNRIVKYQRDKQYCAGLIGFPLRSGYAASKHAIRVYGNVTMQVYKTNITISLVISWKNQH